MDTQPLPSKPNLHDWPQTELTRDVQDLVDGQLWEVLEALQIETARREGVIPTWVALGKPEGPWGQW